MAKIDKLDRLIRDYVNGLIDKKIQARINQLTYKSKVDNLGIHTAYHGGSEQESYILNKERIDEDEIIRQLKYEKSQIEVWYFSYPEAKTICELRWKKGMQQWEIKDEVKMSESTIKRRYNELKEKIKIWGGFEC